MRKLLFALLVAAACAAALIAPPATSPASAQNTATISLFYRELAPHGRWFQHERWGWVWFPAHVEADWRPYSRGRWVYTEEHGWYWDSDEPFGWAVYHYGRWAHDEEYGWLWVPGHTWGPAWVAFRYGDDVVGWAPLPPETLDDDYEWAPAYTALDADHYVSHWLFVPRRRFLAFHVHTHALPYRRNVVVIHRTVNVTRYDRGPRGIFNRGVPPRRLEASLGRPIVPARINIVSEPRRARPAGPDRGAFGVNVYRPAVRVPRDAVPPPETRARPADRPRANVRRDAPAERREYTAPPGPRDPHPYFQPPRTRLDERRAPDFDHEREGRPNRGRHDRRVGVPPETSAPWPRSAPPAASPAPRAFEPERRRYHEDRGIGERRAYPHPGPAYRAPESAYPPSPRSAPPEPRRDERWKPQRPPSYSAPAQPYAAPPAFARPPSPPGASPPPRAMPSAPPHPRAQPAPAARTQPSAPPQKAAPPPGKPVGKRNREETPPNTAR